MTQAPYTPPENEQPDENEEVTIGSSKIPEPVMSKLQALAIYHGETEVHLCSKYLISGVDRAYAKMADEIHAEAPDDPHDRLRETMPKGLVKGDAFPDYDELTGRPTTEEGIKQELEDEADLLKDIQREEQEEAQNTKKDT